MNEKERSKISRSYVRAQSLYATAEDEAVEDEYDDYEEEDEEDADYD